MKMLTVIVRPEKFGDIVAALRRAGVTGMTVTEVRGQGYQKELPQIYRSLSYQADFVQKVKIETVVPDDRVEEVLQAAVAAARTGRVGDGKVFITEVIDAVRVRTGERGDAAVLGPGADM
ncbi:P-II family nitrogen regulator [Hydrogenibacillus schlegelii]|uniref:Nitrogen regulatory protein P-II n=1 Tax=Hydrogenibacillus schlegelii TaxID=1484 RepID=A0A132MZY7_HYDSH|nr:P-II family nitrogen regulator [Hydrogenibacillus schlegelii]KWX03296.1 nitrogen regulatory protein P-II 1 [Hydrogenibacillus schlegelii]MBT9281659.1 P-II family nitrogen regulator [Hydrogenibacillus schlegelii]OAR03938.1 transcriptional regulator [Hydrogenibacillus schlegelii]PTQ52396.1 MAG: Nitrogen regulatory protein P-II [Hydrogenibacillus schlegelii]